MTWVPIELIRESQAFSSEIPIVKTKNFCSLKNKKSITSPEHYLSHKTLVALGQSKVLHRKNSVFSLSLQISYCLLNVKYSSAKQRIAEQVGGETFITFFFLS